MPQSGDFSEQTKNLSKFFYWPRMNTYCAFRIPLIPSACEAFWRRTVADQAAEEHPAAFDSAVAVESETAYRPIAFPD